MDALGRVERILGNSICPMEWKEPLSHRPAHYITSARMAALVRVTGMPCLRFIKAALLRRKRACVTVNATVNILRVP
jgi:hypothetical protein